MVMVCSGRGLLDGVGESMIRGPQRVEYDGLIRGVRVMLDFYVLICA